MSSIPPSKLDELRALLTKATHGPWKAQKHMIVDRLVGMWFLRRSPDITVGSGNDGDAPLIVAAVNTLPDLLDEIERLRGALELVEQGDIPRPVESYWRRDCKPCKHDQCEHGRSMWEDCSECASTFARNALSGGEG